jgi:L-rhamnonate dehydratase
MQTRIERRNLLHLGTIGTAGGLLCSQNSPVATAQAPLPWPRQEADLKITSVRLVKVRDKRPRPSYTPAPKSPLTQSEEVASPMSIYPEYKASRSLFYPDSTRLGGFWVEIGTDKGLTGLGNGGTAGGSIVEGHLTKLLLGKNPFDVERIWDIMWRSTIFYGRKGAVIHAISGVDLALWDLAGKAWGLPVYKLLGGETKPRIPAYITCKPPFYIEAYAAFGYSKLKLALPYGPVDGREGIKQNVELVKRAREAVGPQGHVMVDCWMALTERYTLELAEALEPYRVYWLEECLPPDDYEGLGRLAAQIKSALIVSGEHEYTRYGFRQLLEHKAAAIWQPDIHWCGGLSELRRIGALAAAYDIPVIPHSGAQRDSVHYIMATPNAPWAEFSGEGMPPPGGPDIVYKSYEEDNLLTRGPEGIYTRPSERPGFGWELDVF